MHVATGNKPGADLNLSVLAEPDRGFIQDRSAFIHIYYGFTFEDVHQHAIDVQDLGRIH